MSWKNLQCVSTIWDKFTKVDKEIASCNQCNITLKHLTNVKDRLGRKYPESFNELFFGLHADSSSSDLSSSTSNVQSRERKKKHPDLTKQKVSAEQQFKSPKFIVKNIKAPYVMQMPSSREVCFCRMKWTNNLALELLSLFENEPVIWNPGIPDHKNRNKVADV
nr:unnamed protein product [Callosobruchus analis]